MIFRRIGGQGAATGYNPALPGAAHFSGGLGPGGRARREPFKHFGQRIEPFPRHRLGKLCRRNPTADHRGIALRVDAVFQPQGYRMNLARGGVPERVKRLPRGGPVSQQAVPVCQLFRRLPGFASPSGARAAASFPPAGELAAKASPISSATRG